MAINFPNSPSINDTYTVGDVVYTWNGTTWVVSNALSIQGIQGASGIQGIQGPGANITASNVGTVGVGVFKQKVADNLEFKKLEAGQGVALTDNTDTVAISVPSVPEIDPYWQYVKILHHFNGPDTSTLMLDATQRVWTVVGNAQLDTADKKFGESSLLLDGTGDYIYTAHDADLSTNTGDFTMEAWIKLAVLNRTHMISNKRDGTDAEEHSFQVSSDNTVIGRLWGSGQPQGGVSSLSALTTGVWYHVAFCRTGQTLYLFVDGILQGTADDLSPTANTGVFNIGRDGFDANRNFQGWIDEYRFTKGVNRYTTNFTPPTAPFPQGSSIGYLSGLNDVVIQSNVATGTLLYKPSDWSNTANSSGGLTWDPSTNTIVVSSLGDCGLILRADTDDVSETDNPYVLMTQDAAGIQAEFGIMGNAGIRASTQTAFGGTGFSQNDAYVASNRNINILPGSNSSTVGEVNAFMFTTTRNWSFEPLRVASSTGAAGYIDMDYTGGTFLTVRSDQDAVLNLIADANDVSEDDNPYIFFSQDGGTVTSIMGQCGNTSNVLPDGSAATNILSNDFTVMQLGAWGMVLGSNRVGMLRFANNGDALYNYVPYVLPASTTSLAYLKMPHGVAPTSPVDGDIWTTSDGLFVQINSNTGQMLLSSRTISTTAPLAGGGDLSANRTLSINANGISDSLLRQSAARSVIGRSAGTTGNVADITVSSGSDGVLREQGGTLSFGAIATAGISDNAVTLGKMAQVSTARLLGRVGAGTGNVESLTGTQATTLLDTFTTSLKGVAPASGGGTDNYLRADGTWATPPGAGVSANSFETMTVTDTDSGYTWSETGSAVAASPTSTLTLVSGSNIDIDVDATSKAIKISSSAGSGTGYPPQLGYMGGF